jgi:SPP1 gp7 family putative phage head morphogenesis protein
MESLAAWRRLWWVPKEKSNSSQKTSLSSDLKNGQTLDPFSLLFASSQRNPLEADKIFPIDAESAYISSYFRDSQDFPYNPDPLAGSNNYKIYDEMKHDDQIKAVLSFKKDQIISPGWMIKCEEPEISEFIERNLKETLNCSFEDSLRDILSAFEYGFSLTEPVYRRDKDGFLELKDLKTRPPHSFEFHLNDKGDLLKIRQNATTQYKDFDPKYFLHHIYQPEFGNPFGRSDLRAAHQAWKTKKFFLRFWAIYVERFAAPTVFGTYPDDFGTDKVQRLQQVLNTIQNSTAIAIPEGTKIDFSMASRDSSGVYESGITLLNTMIARAVLMPDLMGMSGKQTGGGSYALGDTQFQLFMGIIKHEQESLARKITLKIIQPLIRANFGDYKAEFQFKPHSKDNAMEALKLWTEATKGKLWNISEEEVKHFLDMVKFPHPETIEINEPMSPLTPIPQGKEIEPDPDEDEEDDKEEAEDKTYVLRFRELTKYETTINFSEIENTLDSVEAKTVKKLASLGKDIYLDYLNQIKERNLLSRFKPELINDLTIHFQKPMNVEMKAFMRDLYRSSYNRAQKELFPKMDKKFALEEDLLPSEFLEIIDAEAFKMVGDYSINITNKMRNRLVTGLKNGVNEREMLKQLRELGEDETDKWLKTVIRTKSTEMFNRGRKSFWDNDEFAKQIIEAYQYSAIMDDRTSDVCRELDGKVFEKGEYTTHLTPPLHFNCRSILVPVTKFEDYTASKEISLEKLKESGGNLIV